MSEPKPKVSVLMITYNHEKYIEQAVRSVMMQETDFEYEIIIGEDCSTDRTREILVELQRKSPERIKLISHPRNIGMVPNSIYVLNCARAEYIALLEGDDYWTSPHKLQQQVDYMEAHPECRICTHDAYVVDSGGEIIETRDYQNIYNIEEYFEAKKFIVTSSMLFRSPHQQLPSWFSLLKAATDWPLHIWLLMQGGTIHHFEGPPMSSWRVHNGGVASFMTYTVESMSDGESYQRTTARILQQIHDLKIVCQEVPEQIKCYIRENIYKSYVSLARKTYSRDAKIFYEAYEELCRLSPNGRYIPNSPRLLSTASRFLGYPRAEWLSGVYRELLPLAWRKKLYKK